MVTRPHPRISHRAAQLEAPAPEAPGRELVAAVKATGIPSFTVRHERQLFRITVTLISATPPEHHGNYQRVGYGRP